MNLNISQIRPEPTEWDFTLFNTYQQLTSCNDHFFRNLDRHDLLTCKKIADYFADKGVGISVNESEVELIKRRFEQYKDPNTQNKLSVANEDDADEIYKKFHPEQFFIFDLFSELRQEIYRFTEVKDLLSLAISSKSIRKEIYTNQQLLNRILLKKALKISENFWGLDKKLSLRYITMAYASCGFYKEAFEILEIIEDSGDKELALEYIAKSKADNGKINEALELASSLTFMRDDALVSIARAQAKRGLFDEMMATINLIKKHHKANALQTIALYLIGREELGQAYQLAMLISKDHEKSVVLKIFVLECASKGLIKESWAIWENIIVQEFKDEAAVAIVTALANMGNFEEANAKINVIQYESKQNKAKSEIAQAQAASGDFPGAFKTIDSITPSIVWDKNYQSEIKIRVALLQIEQGFHEQGKLTIESALQNVEGDSALSNIAIILIQGGLLEKAFDVAMRIKDGCSQSYPLAEIAKILADRGDIEDSGKIIMQISSFRSFTAEDIVTSLIRARNLSGAKTIVELITDTRCKARAKIKIAAAQKNCYLHDEAMETIDSVLSLVNTNNESYDNLRFLLAIVAPNLVM